MADRICVTSLIGGTTGREGPSGTEPPENNPSYRSQPPPEKPLAPARTCTSEQQIASGRAGTIARVATGTKQGGRDDLMRPSSPEQLPLVPLLHAYTRAGLPTVADLHHVPGLGSRFAAILSASARFLYADFVDG